MKSHWILLLSLAVLLASCTAQTLESITEEPICKSNCRCKAIENYWDAVLLFDDEENSGFVANASSPPTAFGSALFELALVVNNTAATVKQIQNNTFEFGLRYALFVVANRTLFAHIHVGKRCNEGPIVAFLFNSSATPVNSTGLLASGYITAKNLTGPLTNHSLWSLIEEIEAGNAYVNVHTVPYPAGEARGQIQFTQPQSHTVLDLINSTRCSKSFGTFYQLFNFSTFNSSSNSSVNSTALNSTLSLSDLNNSSRNFTVFFPPDNILAAVFESLASNNITESDVEDFLSAHIVSGYFTAADLHSGFNNSGLLNLTTIAGSILLIGGPGHIVPGLSGTPFLQSSLTSSVQINNSTIIIGENSVVANNGIIHSINRPLVQLAFQQNTTTTTPVSQLRMKLFARAMRYF